MNTEAQPESPEKARVRLPFLSEETQQFLEKLSEDPHAFDFFQAIRRMDATMPGPKTGFSTHPRHEPVRLGQTPSPEFAPATISKFDIEIENSPPELKAKLCVYFMGLCGPNGPMPLTFTELVYRRMRGIVDPDSPHYDFTGAPVESHTSADNTLADFLDVFHHRLISLFYRAWAEVRKTVDYDRLEDQRFAGFFGSLIGIGSPALTERTAIPDDAKYDFSGHLSCQTRHADGLASILEDYYGVKASILEFIGHWIDLPESSKCRLGESPETGRLGDSLVVGESFWDCQLRFRIRLGAMKLADYERFLPGGESTALRDLRLWVLHYVGYEFFVDAQIVLRKEDVPAVSLGVSGRLGYTTWVRDEKSSFPRDADDLILELKL